MRGAAAWLAGQFALGPGPSDWIGGVRLAAAFVLPVAVGLAAGETFKGLFVGIGAFMVANADLGESYAQRLRLMVPCTIGVAGLTAAGMALGDNDWVAVPVGCAVLFLAGLSPAVGREAGLFGTFLAFAYVIGMGIATAPDVTIPEVVVALLAGGAYAMLLSAVHVLVVRPAPDGPPEPWSELAARTRARITPDLTWQAVRLAVAGGIGMVIVPFTEQTNGAWLVTGALIVLKPAYGDTLRAAITRGVGTVAGAVVAGTLAAATGNAWVLLVAAFALVWLAEALIGRSFGLFVVLITPLSVLLSNVLVSGDWEVALWRTADVAAGSLIAIVVATVVPPRRHEARSRSPASD